MQLTMNLPFSVPPEAYRIGPRSSGEVHGVVLTKPHIVDLILDLAQYSQERDLARLRLLEPACGRGAFLRSAVARLITSAKLHRRNVADLESAICAYDIDPFHVEETRRVVLDVLNAGRVRGELALRLAGAWVKQGDFLLTGASERFDVVVGNPPYVRIEQLPGVLMGEYRRRFRTLFDRADIYVAFIEHGLNLLGPNGVLAFVCADRWTLNRYGAVLRRLVTERFQLRHYVDLNKASPFESDVIAYPAVFAIGHPSSEPVHVTTLPTASPEECSAVLPAIAGTAGPASAIKVDAYQTWYQGEEPWLRVSPRQLSVLRALEERHRLIEDCDARVRIGVATGNDRLYIVDGDADIEQDRLVPLVMREDIENGRVRDAHRFVINTFEDTGRPVELKRYPRLARYFELHAPAIRARHVAQKNKRHWFRTIDRVYPALARERKLLIPDIAGSNEVVLEDGRFHPHHNLYFITSGSWDMGVLGALLSSKVALFFVWAYAVKMRGGYLRFQAQYLRRIRLPNSEAVKPTLAKSLAKAFEARDFERIDALALKAYEIESLPDFDFVDTRS